MAESGKAGLQILVHIKYQCNGDYRCVLVQKGSKLSDILDTFMKLFADVIPIESKPDDFKFMLVQCKTLSVVTYDYVLKNNDLLVATLKEENNGPIVPHAIEPNLKYYMWSICSKVNQGVMKLDTTTMTIKCDGNMDDPANLINFQANVVGQDYYAYTLPTENPDTVYVIKGAGENMDIKAEEMNKSDIKPDMGDEYKFLGLQFFGKMQFQCAGVGDPTRTDLCMSSMPDGTLQLQQAGERGYPKPTTLFIATRMA